MRRYRNVWPRLRQGGAGSRAVSASALGGVNARLRVRASGHDPGAAHRRTAAVKGSPSGPRGPIGGRWGSGKTSLLNLVIAAAREEAEVWSSSSSICGCSAAPTSWCCGSAPSSPPSSRSRRTCKYEASATGFRITAGVGAARQAADRREGHQRRGACVGDRAGWRARARPERRTT